MREGPRSQLRLASSQRWGRWLLGAALTLATTAPAKEQWPAQDFYPAWAASAAFNRPLLVRDTDSAIGRLSLWPKQLSLGDASRVHGHLCDGLAIAWVTLGVGLRWLFPDGAG